MYIYEIIEFISAITRIFISDSFDKFTDYVHINLIISVISFAVNCSANTSFECDFHTEIFLQGRLSREPQIFRLINKSSSHR